MFSIAGCFASGGFTIVSIPNINLQRRKEKYEERTKFSSCGFGKKTVICHRKNIINCDKKAAK